MTDTTEVKELNVTAQAIIDAALCAWEHVLERLKARGSNKWKYRRQKAGMAALREHVAALALTIELAYQEAKRKGYDDCFDWEFVPKFLEAATDNNCDLLVDWSRVIDRIVSPQD